MKIRHIMPVFVVLLFLGVASTAFAQVGCNVSSTPVSRDTLTGLTEPAGDITFTCTQTGAAGSGSAATTITVSYGPNVPITNLSNNPLPGYPAARPISITAVQTTTLAGSPVVPCGQPSIGTTGVSNSTGQIVITVPALGPGTGSSCSFTLTGVLLGIFGAVPSSGNVSAFLSVAPATPALSITAGQDKTTVVTQVMDGICKVVGSGCIADGVKGPLVPALALTSGTVLANTAVITVKENYIDAYRGQAQFNGGASTQGVDLLFTFTGLVTGETLTCAVPTLDNGGTVGLVTPAGGVVNSTTPTMTVEILTANLSTIDTLSMSCVFAFGATTTIPVAAGSITATVTLAPVGTAFSSGGAVLTSTTAGQIPRYSLNPLSAGTIVNIISATTHMLIPYATVQPGFDTGVAIANTSSDPYGFTSPVNISGGARALSGPATLVFYPVGGGSTPAGAPFCVATGAGAAGTTGGALVNGIAAGCPIMSLTGRGTTGLSTGGVIGAGSSWVFLGSEMMSQMPSPPASFIGYIFVIANFPYAHPTAYVVDAAFSGKFTSGGPALVLPNPSTYARTNLGGLGVINAGGVLAGLPLLSEALGH